MYTVPQIGVLVLVAGLGHLMAMFWYVADCRNSRLCRKTIYDMPLPEGQLRREIINSMHTPIHAVMLAAALGLGFFQNTSFSSFLVTALATTIWAEIWHYFSHRAFHIQWLHWIHREHHKSKLNSPFTAISFSFWEKLIFNFGMIGCMATFDVVVGLNFYGVAGWYIGYLVINSFSHANFEIRSDGFLRFFGKFIATTTYHSLHHSRYINNYGLGTRVLDRTLGTEWADYEKIYERVNRNREPLTRLGEKEPPLVKR